MDKMILIEFPLRKTGIPATLLVQEEPEMCQTLWDLLGQPMKMICHHTLSTGDYFPWLWPASEISYRHRFTGHSPRKETASSQPAEARLHRV